MIDLDDAAAIRLADPSDMLGAVAGIATQCRAGHAAGLAASNLPSGDGVRSIVFCGMGGSGISGDVIRALYTLRLPVPVVVVRGSELPEFCGTHTLVVCSSYSGDTEETLSCFDEAVERGCRLVAITSGGELSRRAHERGIALRPIPAGFMPRAAMGYLAMGSLAALEAVGLIPSLAADLDESTRELEALADRLGPDRPVRENDAKVLALATEGRTPMIWGAEGIGSVAAARWKTQFNENAKIPAFAASLPELDHNEVVGWAPGEGERFYLVALRHEGEPADVAARFPHSIRIAEESGMAVDEVRAAGRSPLARLFSLVIMGDFASVYLAIARGVDPSPVHAIDRLKRALAEA